MTPRPYRLRRVEIKCQVCGVPFSVQRYRADKTMCCSTKCAGTYRKGKGHTNKRTYEQIENTCCVCGKKFVVPPSRQDAVYCSKDCLNSRPSIKEECTCEQCGALFKIHPSELSRGCRRFCSRECYQDERMSTKNATLARRACDRCGWNHEPGILQIHHKDENRRNNTLENLELLCPNCHCLHHYVTKTGPFTQVGIGKQAHRKSIETFRQRLLESRAVNPEISPG